MNKKVIIRIVLICSMLFAVGTGVFTFIQKDFQTNLITLEKPSNWKEYSAADARYKVNFPAEPVLENKQLDIPSAGQSLNFEQVSAEKKKAVYALSHVDFPRKWTLLGSNTLLKKSLDLLVENEVPAQQLLSKETTSHQGYPALDYVVSRGGDEVKGRLVLVGTTLYRLTVSYPSELKETVQHEQFVSSFNLVG